VRNSPTPIKPDPHYRRSLTDKLGPDGADLFRALNWSILPITAGFLIGFFWVARRGLPPNHSLAAFYLVLGGLLGAVIIGGSGMLVIFGMSHGAGAGMEAFVYPGGAYKRDYSLEDSFVARGEIDRAIASYETIAAAEQDNFEVRMRAAELCRKNSFFDKAAAFYRDVQSRAAKDEDVRASMRLIDLYLIWPDHKPKAMSELRRLMDRYPDTAVAESSRKALANLKSEHFPAAG
jgi:tetratricopeptide (TPR) repeat protein